MVVSTIHAIPRFPPPRPPRPPWRRAIIALLAGLFLVGLDASAPAQVEEAELKHVMATWISRIGKYVTWPDGTFPDQGKRLVIGVVGKDPFGETIDLAGKKEKPGGRSIQIKRIPSLARGASKEQIEKFTVDLHRCHMLFVCKSEKKAWPRILKICERRPILTLSDIGDFSRNGGMIEFVLEKKRLHFDVNRTMCERTRLVIKPQFLEVARRVHGKPK